MTSRQRLADVLRAGGVRVGDPSDGECASIIDFVESWGVIPGATASCDALAIKAALAASGVAWTMGNMVHVAKTF